MTRTPEQTRRLFDEWAATYERNLEHPGSVLEGHGESLQEALSMLALSPGTRVLDIGIGAGAFGALLMERGAAINGIDVCTEMVERCRWAHPEFVLKVGGFTPIPYDDGQFDAVVSSFAFHEVEPVARTEACSEMARVLKPGGLVCLVDSMFASIQAAAESRRMLGCHWDEDEDYPLVGALDGQLRAAGISAMRWRQTAPCHLPRLLCRIIGNWIAAPCERLFARPASA